MAGVGTTIHYWLKSRGIRPTTNCPCKKLMQKMDQMGSHECRNQLEDLTNKLQDSAKKWRQEARAHPEEGPQKLTQRWVKYVAPPRLAFRKLILRACDEVDRSSRTIDTSPFERRGNPTLPTVCITYYMRPVDLERMVDSIPGQYGILIQDTGGNLSWGRNQLMQRCSTRYALIVEEDMEWTEQTEPEQLIDVLCSDEPVQFVAGRVLDGRQQWHHRFRIEETDEGRHLLKSDYTHERRTTKSGVHYFRCDLTKNFGVVDTDFARSHPWDERLPLSEHMDWFYRMWKHNRGQAAYVESVGIKHYSSRPTQAYLEARLRAWPLHKTAEDIHNLTFVEPTPDEPVPHR